MAPLGQLHNLRTLKVGRPIYQEAAGLARAVASLELLEILEVQCCPYEYHINGVHGMDFISTHNISPLIPFLEALQTLISAFESHHSPHLPKSLKTLLIQDCFRATPPYLFQLLARAVRNCEDLVKLMVAIRHDNNAEYCFELPTCRGQARKYDRWRMVMSPKVDMEDVDGNAIDPGSLRVVGYCWRRGLFEEIGS